MQNFTQKQIYLGAFCILLAAAICHSIPSRLDLRFSYAETAAGSVIANENTTSVSVLSQAMLGKHLGHQQTTCIKAEHAFQHCTATNIAWRQKQALLDKAASFPKVFSLISRNDLQTILQQHQVDTQSIAQKLETLQKKALVLSKAIVAQKKKESKAATSIKALEAQKGRLIKQQKILGDALPNESNEKILTSYKNKLNKIEKDILSLDKRMLPIAQELQEYAYVHEQQSQLTTEKQLLLAKLNQYEDSTAHMQAQLSQPGAMLKAVHRPSLQLHGNSLVRHHQAARTLWGIPLGLLLFGLCVGRSMGRKKPPVLRDEGFISAQEVIDTSGLRHLGSYSGPHAPS